MILIPLLLIPVAGGLLAWATGRRWPGHARAVALAAVALDAVAAARLLQAARHPMIAGAHWLTEVRAPWIPSFGVQFHLAVDGLSLALVLLTAFLGVLAVAASWTAVRERQGLYYLNLLLVLAGVLGVFLAMDLFLFYFFWELMLIPMFFLIDIWGHENRHAAAIKFLLFTQISGLLMLVAILVLYVIHGRATGLYTFDYEHLRALPLTRGTARWLLLGFAAAFLVKLPAVPFHTWLPDAHTQAPTGGSILLAGLLLKTGAYGLLRFGVPLFPAAAMELAPVALGLGAVGIVYGAWQAFGQHDLKRLVAYTSVSHLGFVLVGIAAWNTLALNGAVLQMVCHGLSTGALFMLVGFLDERLHSRDMRDMGGLWARMPRMGAAAMLLAMASLGLPGLGNFVGEFLVLLGTFRVSKPAAVAGCVGMVFAAVYALALIQRTFHGPPRRNEDLRDLHGRELACMLSVAVALLWLGVWPRKPLNLFDPALEELRPTPADEPAERLLARSAQREAAP